ncbi:eukaryotic translation initiation factor 2-alpha kinase 1-like [Acropora palmata]|uniref:eukaryotic translation initiation factor 2-alpha kinase 1-like n=1 Tax=Acropora palmata TaxID=6131 RepID=UPI003D9FF6F8
MASNTRSKWTRSRLESPGLPSRLTEFQDSDSSETFIARNDPTSSIQALEGRVPNYLLLVSLLEQLCSLYEGDSEKSNKIFTVLCQQLVKMKVMPSFSFLEEFSVIRAKYKTVFSDLMQAAARTTGTDLHKFPLATRRPMLNPFPAHKSLSAPPKMSDLMQNVSSRYKEEFVEIARIGKGGFGSVFKVKNKLDGREYAVKKIPLKETDPDLWLKVLREVKVLAHLSHNNVVGYHGAWLEYVTTDNIEYAIPRVATLPTSLKELCDFSSLNGIQRIMEVSCSDSQNSIVFEGSSQDISNGGISFAACRSSNDSFGTGTKSHGAQAGCQPGKSPRSSTNSSRSSKAPYLTSQRSMRRSASSSSLGSLAGKDGVRSGEEPSDPSERSNAISGNIEGNTTRHKRLGMVLFIQMQLCTTTLRDWLVKRNDDVLRTGEEVDEEAAMEIFRQLLEGVRYIHSEDVLHRDLKPRNIFLQWLLQKADDRPIRFQVKIGDFGLARKEAVVSPGAGSPLASLIEPHSPLFNPGFSKKHAATAGVGTCTYASPEQLRDNNYDNKADIFSLGIILFELFCSFGTEMERVTSIKDIRQCRLPQEFCQRWPEVAKLITEMTAERPDDRPTAETLLETGLFKEKHVHIGHHLNERVEQQASEIAELKALLSQKNSEVQTREEEISDLKRQLEKNDEFLKRIFDNLCSACNKKIGSQVEEMDTG